jgi:hypothetical protein
MASSRRQKNSCMTCGTMTGIFSCRGCTKNFCLRHTTEHREQLQKSMNEIVYNYDQLKRNMKGQTAEQYQNILMEQVDQWEQRSIEKVRQLAEETRQELLVVVRERTDDLKEKIEQLKQQLDQARQDGGFYENDLRDWMERLNELQRTFIEQQTIKIDEDVASAPFISRISLNDAFRKDVRFNGNHHQNNDQNHFDDYTSTHEQQDFSSGKHQLRFKIEKFDASSSILFGIISKNAPTSSNSNKINPTFYGWAEKDLVYRDGVAEQSYNGYYTDFQSHEVYTLTVDCDQAKIALTSEQTHHSYDLEVDLTRCPLPWQSNVRLFNNVD